MSNAKKVAVVLFNLGGPDTRDAIRPFLLNFFNDPNIIGAPQPIRGWIARYIAWKRSKREAGDSYGMLGDKSPLLENTYLQADALKNALNGGHIDFTVHVCMRYWHPMADQVVAEVVAQKPDQIILLPLYPQFSTTTSWSSLQDWQRAMGAAGAHIPTAMICCYPDDSGFIKASAENVKIAYDAMCQDYPSGKNPRVLFSAHGLPEKIIKGGDPYQAQCEDSAKKIVAAMGVENLDWQVCYQSKVGPLKWIGPSTDEAIHKAAKDGVPVIIYPHAFVSEHVETLVEIEHEYRDLAVSLGVPAFSRVPTVMDHPDFINGLAALVRARVGQTGITSNRGVSICPSGSKRCCMRMNVDGLSSTATGSY